MTQMDETEYVVHDYVCDEKGVGSELTTQVKSLKKSLSMTTRQAVRKKNLWSQTHTTRTRSKLRTLCLRTVSSFKMTREKGNIK